MGQRNDGLMGLFIGITRSGKSTPIKAMIAKANRLLVWDAKNEYGPTFNLTVIRSLPELLNRLKKTKGKGRFAFVPTGYNRKEFELFCRLAHIWNRQSPCVIVIEELAAVTNAGKASGYWGVLVNQSLGLGATLLATVQRGQEVDKSIMNASTYMHVCQHNTEDDARYMAKKLGVKIEDIPRVPLQFIIWSASKGLIFKGKVQFKRNQPYFTSERRPQKKLIFSNTIGLFKGVAYR